MATTCAIQNNFIPRGSFQLIFWNKKRLFLHVQIYRHTTQVLSKADSPTLSENKFSLKLFPLRKVVPVLEKLRKVIGKRGYNLDIYSISDIYMCDTSFVAYEDGRLIILVHIPMYKNLHLMK